MSSLFDVPAQLALVLSLAASAAGGQTGAPPALETTAPVPIEAVAPETADGPYRFSDCIWYRALKEDAAGADAEDVAGSIFRTSGGRYYVPASAERQRILAKRRDVALAARTARSFAARNAKRMEAALARAPTAGELYIAHMFGPEAAVAFIKRVATAPREPAEKHLPELVHIAPARLSVDGAALTLAQVYERMTQPLAARARAVGSAAAMQLRQEPARDLIAMKPTFAGMAQQAPGGFGAAGGTWAADGAAARQARSQ